MPLVRDSFSPRVRCFSCPGEDKSPIYQPDYVKGDCRVLKQVGEECTYEIIQSYKEECSVKKIVERYRNGDLLALQRVQAVYTDTSGAPGSLAEAFDKVKYLNSVFDSLSDDAKSFYGDVSGFVTGVLAGQYPAAAAAAADDNKKGGDVNE